MAERTQKKLTKFPTIPHKPIRVRRIPWSQNLHHSEISSRPSVAEEGHGELCEWFIPSPLSKSVWFCNFSGFVAMGNRLHTISRKVVGKNLIIWNEPFKVFLLSDTIYIRLRNLSKLAFVRRTFVTPCIYVKVKLLPKNGSIFCNVFHTQLQLTQPLRKLAVWFSIEWMNCNLEASFISGLEGKCFTNLICYLRRNMLLFGPKD